jgi:hypothetical protein
MTDEQAAAYIAGFMDGEGHIGCHKMASGHWTRSISFCNTDPTLVGRMAELLKQLGFSVRVQHDRFENEKWSERWTTYIAGGRPSFERFRRLIPIQAPAKIAALDKILSTYVPAEQVHAAKRNGETLPCETCGKPVYACKVIRARGGGRFCSIDCRGLSQRKQVAKNCEICGTEYSVIQAYAPKSRFCSRRCTAEHQRRTQSDKLRSQAKAAAAARWHKPKSSG